MDLRTIVTLARAVQARDPYAAGRSEHITRLAQLIAGDLVGVVCADIGRIGPPDRLLQGRGQLSDEDYATLRSYPAMSSYILGELDLPAVVKEMARCNALPSERKDRPNYVDRLTQQEDAMKARIARIETVKPTLLAFYNTLSPEQKAVLDGPTAMGGMMMRRHHGAR